MPTFLELATARLHNEPHSLAAVDQFLDALGAPNNYGAVASRVDAEDSAVPAEPDAVDSDAVGACLSSERHSSSESYTDAACNPRATVAPNRDAVVALTSTDAGASDSPSERAQERAGQRTSDAPPYRTDPDQPRPDLLKRTRSSLVTEVLRLRRECANTRVRLRDAEDRLNTTEVTDHE